MSFEVFMQCFTEGERDGIPAADLQRAFGPQLQVGEGDWWKVVYDQQNWCDILLSFLPPERKLVHSVTVQRPCGDERLWEALLAVLKLGNVVLYFPAEKPPLIVAQPRISEHLPKDMVESMGPITPVGCVRDILDEIQKA
jgi:hypothetical protein